MLQTTRRGWYREIDEEVFNVQECILLCMCHSFSQEAVAWLTSSLLLTCQSQACQLKHWKKHKFHCSLLPIGNLAYVEAVDADSYAKIESEVQRVSEVLQTWMDAYEPYIKEEEQNKNIDKRRVALPEDKLIKGASFG